MSESKTIYVAPDSLCNAQKYFIDSLRRDKFVSSWGGAVSAAQNNEMTYLLCGGETPPPQLIERLTVQLILRVALGEVPALD